MRGTYLKALIFAFGLLVCGARGAQAQGAEGKWEAGVQFSAFNVTEGEADISLTVACVNPPCPVQALSFGERRTEHGIGARLGYSFNRYS
jgi:hypothetical protein